MFRIKRRMAIVAIFISGAVCPVLSIPSLPRFKYYTSEDGLLSNTVFQIAQDSRGFMWFGSSDGLNRFDGYRFKNFFTAEQGLHTPPEISAIVSLGPDDLWLGASGKVYTYDYSADEFNPVDTLNTTPKSTITCIAGEKDSIAWIGTTQSGIFRYNRKTHAVTQYTDPMNASALFITKTGALLAVSFQGVVYQYEAKNNQFIEISSAKHDEYSMSIACAVMAENGDIWMGDWSLGVFCYNLKTQQLTNYRLMKENRPIERVHSIIEYTADLMMIGSDEGLTILDKKTGSSHTITANQNPGETSALNSRFIYPLYKDKDNGIWIGTYFGGVNYLSPDKTSFQTRARGQNPGTNLGQVVSQFYEGDDQTIWIGTDDGGVQRFDLRTRTLQHIPIGGINEPLNVHALYSEGDYLWVGTYEKGIYRYHIPSGQTTHFPEIQSVYLLFRDQQQTLWAGSPSGLFKFDPNSEHFYRNNPADQLLGIEAMAQTADQRIWIVSSSKGLSCLNPQTGRVQHYDSLLRDAGINSFVNTLHILDGTIWLGTTREGLYGFDIASGRLQPAPVRSDVLNTTRIQYITSSDNNHLWITTTMGLFRYHVDDHTLDLFTRDDGLLSDQFNQSSGLRTRTGLLFIGSNQGFIFFDPKDISPYLEIPHVRFSDVQVYSKANGKVTRPPSDHLVLRPNETVLTIEFSSMYYRAPAKVRYRYKLEGFDESFIETTQSAAVYTNIPPGKYTFTVTPMSSFGVWSDESATVEVTVLPPWWLSKEMKVLYILLGMAGIGLTIFLFVRRSRQKNAERIEKLKQENEQKTIASKMAFFTHIAHEIRTPATLIAAPIEGILRSGNLPETVADDMQIIHRNSNRLISLINQALDLRNMDHGYTHVYYEPTDIGACIGEYVSQFKPFCDKKQIDLHFQQDASSALVGAIDRDIVHKILTNLISNAIKFTSDRIDVSLSPDRDGFSIQVADNGRGIPQEDIPRIFDPFFTTASPDRHTLKGFGIGLSLVAGLAAKIGAEITVESEKGSFTRFRIYIPFGQASSPTPDTPTRTSLISEDSQRTEKQIDSPFRPAPHFADRPTVLMVEDNTELSAYLGKFIQEHYNVMLAHNGAEALERLTREPVDVVVTDISMPEMDGITLCERIRSDVTLCHLPIIMLTADTNVESKINSIENGADVYLEKPVSLELLTVQIATLLRKYDYLRNLFGSTKPTPLSSMAEKDQDKAFLGRIETLILEHLSDPDFSVDQLAKQTGISRSGLYAKLSSLSELAPNELIRSVRLQKAAEYLLSGEYRINEVCYLVGFSSPSYFTRCFVRQFGTTPKEYAKKDSAMLY